MTKRAGLVAALLAVLLPATARAQRVYPVTLVGLAPAVQEQLASGYRAGAGRERAWCVTRWTTADSTDYTAIVVTQVRTAVMVTASAARVTAEWAACDSSDGSPLPTIHSHPSGTCQASPDDRDAYLTRLAPFDGVLCGERAVVWYFSAELMDMIRGHTH